MTSQKQKLIESLERDIKRAQESIKALDRVPIDIISDAFPEGKWMPTWGNHFEFTLPFDFVLISQVKDFMSNNVLGFSLKRENRFVWDTTKSAGHFLEYESFEENWWDRVEFQIGFRTEQEGTTCVLNQIGKKEVPVYEVVCSAGAQEKI